jgi:hypothetical protein
MAAAGERDEIWINCVQRPAVVDVSAISGIALPDPVSPILDLSLLRLALGK